jgi:prepilin-type N-terminal cleavage/methylation domain-containing protein
MTLFQAPAPSRHCSRFSGAVRPWPREGLKHPRSEGFAGPAALGRQARNAAGFSLAELLIVISIIALIVSIALPKLISTKVSANESAAISALRTLASAQAQLQTSQAIDCDSDGAGEFGYFAELAGAVPLREDNGTFTPQVGTELLDPRILSTSFGFVDNATVSRSGYLFQIYLSDGAGAGVPEAPNGGMGALVDPDGCETFWCCYAWPLDAGSTGNRAFFVNQNGDIWQHANGMGGYSGLGAAPLWNAAFAVGGSDMGAEIANGAAGTTGQDGNIWTSLQL